MFGLINPEPKTFTGTFDAQEITFQALGDNLFGDVKITISAGGQFQFQEENIPVLGFESVTAEGTITAEKMKGTYAINFSAGNPAEGIFELLKRLLAVLRKL